MIKIKVKRKIRAYIVIMLIGAVVISSSISALELNKNFAEDKNIVKPTEKQSMANPKSLVYSSTGPGLIWLKGNGWLDLTTGMYNFTFSGCCSGLRFIPIGSSPGPAIAWQTSATFEWTAGQLNPAGFTFLTIRSGGSSVNVWVIGYVNSAFTIIGESYP
jgi:hypothetical protein